jgi:hypothetical protein
MSYNDKALEDQMMSFETGGSSSSGGGAGTGLGAPPPTAPGSWANAEATVPGTPSPVVGSSWQQPQTPQTQPQQQQPPPPHQPLPPPPLRSWRPRTLRFYMRFGTSVRFGTSDSVSLEVWHVTVHTRARHSLKGPITRVFKLLWMHTLA